MSPPPGQPIRAALQAIAADLEAGDPVAAARALEGLGAACQASADVQLDDPTLAELRALVDRCQHLAARNHDNLTTTLLMFGAGNRANHAYRKTRK